MQVRLTGEGDAGREGGGTGNLYVYIDVQEHQYFDREGSDLTYVLPVNIAEAALGAHKLVPTLDGKDEDLKLPQGTQPGTEFRIKGKGVPHLHGSRRGDLRVTVDVRVPGSLDNRQQELLQELAESFAESSGSSPKGGPDDGDDKGIFDKIKEALG
jgi:molecular chaperone DnaJ